MFDPDSLMRIRDVAWRAKTLVAATTAGVHRSPQHGASIEFSEYRSYTPGDDPRLIDWKLYGRSDRYDIKRFEDETARRCYLVIDQSRSMGYQTVGHTKLAFGQTIAATFAMYLHRRRDRVGLVAFDDSIATMIEPSRRPSQLPRLFKALSVEDRGTSTNASEALGETASMLPPRALVILISDGLCPLEDLSGPLALLAGRQHELLWIRPLDPGEIELSASDGTQLIDRETGETRFVDQGIIDRYHERFTEHARGLGQMCDDLGVTMVTVRTDQPLVEQIVEIFESASNRRSVDLTKGWSLDQTEVSLNHNRERESGDGVLA